MKQATDKHLRAAPTFTDWALAAAVALVGGLLVLLAIRRDPDALSLLAGLDGSVAAVVVGSLLARLEGLRFRSITALLAPVILIQGMAIRAEGFALPAPLGLELLLVGALGLFASPQRQPAHTVSPSAAPEDARAERPAAN